MSGIDVFLRYEVNEITGCWIWTGYKNDDGYARQSGENAHRLFYERFVGGVPEGWDVDHLCKRRSCVNPEHLEAVPEAVNIERSAMRYVDISGIKTPICREGHLIRGRNTASNGRDRLRCWLCARGVVGPRGPYRRRLEAIADAS